MTFAGRSVMVTGAGGSIGSQLCELIARQYARRLTMVSLTENGLYNVHRHIKGQYSVELNPVLGSVTDVCLMAEALQDVDIVIHAAAHKHVPICEQNPTEAIINNVFGTKTLATLAAEFAVPTFCLISTDKAVQPASIMGATKRVAEGIVRGLGYHVVRFGNVLDSAGSVLPLWREQIRNGGPITLTDERCERYFMSIPQAVRLVSEVIRSAPAGTYVLDMGEPRKLIDMAYELMQAEVGREVGIRFVGLRPGEKLTEELHHGGELTDSGIPGVWRVDEPRTPPDHVALEQMELACLGCDVDTAKALLWEMVR
jgi:FlaA1/EpsC-like NDP-sugar epimerase